MPLVPGAMMLGGLVATAGAVKPLVRSLQSTRWPSVEGTIAGADIDAEGSQREAAATVVYRYTVQGRQYHGSQVSFNPSVRSLLSLDEALHTFYRYRPGTLVQVYYDPTAPERSVLEPGIGLYFVVTAILGLGMFAWALMPKLR